jgi:Uri superfamily endonuclease
VAKNIKGIYVLILKIEKEESINVGKFGNFIFEKAYYAYVGSAMTGIHRLKRHLKNLKKRDVKNKYWHIDFIIPYCKFIGYFFAECSDRCIEENLAISLSKNLNYVKGFGASDSRAPSHLFKNLKLRKLKSEVIKALEITRVRNFKTNINAGNT